MRLPTVLFALWCAAVLAAFAYANSQGYAAFADASKPNQVRYFAGQQHK